MGGVKTSFVDFIDLVAFIWGSDALVPQDSSYASAAVLDLHVLEGIASRVALRARLLWTLRRNLLPMWLKASSPL